MAVRIRRKAPMRGVFGLLLYCCGLACVAQESKDTINSIGRTKKPTPANKNTTATNRKPAGRASNPKPANRTASTPRSKNAVPKPVEHRLVVSGLGKGDFKTITDALRVAKPGTEIVVRPGVYRESLILTKPVALIPDPEASGDSIIIESSAGPCLTLQTSRASVRGLTLTCHEGGESGPVCAIDVPSGQITLEDCSVQGGTRGSVRITGQTAYVSLSHCRIKAGSGAALLFNDKSQGRLERCDISGGRPASVLITADADPTLKDCKIHDSPAFGVLSKDGVGTLTDCEIVASGSSGICISGPGKTVMRGGHISETRADGALVERGGVLMLEGVEIHHTGANGVYATDKGRLEAKDCIIHDLQRPRGETGNGAFANSGGVLALDGGEIYKVGNSGIWADTQTKAYIHTVLIHDTGHDGVSLNSAEEGIVEGCTIATVTMNGIGIVNSHATVRKCKISGARGSGIWTAATGHVFVDNCDILQNANRGIDATDPKTVIVTDSRVQ